MTERTLRNLEQLLDQQNFRILTVEEIEEIRRQVKNDLREQQIKDFLIKLKLKLPDGPNETKEQQEAMDEAFERFYDQEWTIQFGELKVTIGNDAIMYNGICDTLAELITEYNM